MAGEPQSQEPESTINLGDYFAIFKRRRAVVFLAAGMLLCLSLAAALLARIRAVAAAVEALPVRQV